MAAELTFAEARNVVVAALERAADTLKRLPMPRNGMPARERSSWPAIPDDPNETCSRDPQSHVNPPRARAISELDQVLPWLRTLSGADRRIVWARAIGLSWPRLAREFGISVGQVRYRWTSAIDRVVIAAVHDTTVSGAGVASHRGPCQTHHLAR